MKKLEKMPIDELKIFSRRETIQNFVKEKSEFSSHLILRLILGFYKIKLSQDKSSFNCSINLDIISHQRILIIYQLGKNRKKELVSNLKKNNIKYQELSFKELLILSTNNKVNHNSGVFIISLKSILNSKNQENILNNLFNNNLNYPQNIIFYGLINAIKNKESPTYKIVKKLSNYKPNIVIFHEDNNNPILNYFGKVEKNDNFLKFITNLKQEKTKDLEIITKLDKISLNSQELMNFVRDNLEILYKGTVVKPIDSKDQFKDILIIKLSDHAQLDLKDYCFQFNPRLRTFLTDHECKCIFNFTEKPSKIPPCFEFIDLTHPLVKWLINRLELKPLSFVPVCAINLDLSEVKEVKNLSTLTKGNYFYSVYFLSQNKTNYLMYQVLNLEDKRLLENIIAKDLIEFASREGEYPLDPTYKANKISDYYDDYLNLQEKFTTMGGVNISAGLIYLK